MAKAKKLPSGNWRVQVFDYTDHAGKRHYKSFTAVTRKEAEYLAAEFSLNKKDIEKEKPINITIKEAVTRYCEMKSNILSPSTLYGYEKMKKSYFNDINDLHLSEINTDTAQKWINKLSINHSPKTVHNAHGLLSAVLDASAPDIVLKTSLPQKVRPKLYVPSDSDIRLLIDFVSAIDKDMELAICLAAFGTLRRSEICALDANDVNFDENVILVQKAVVINSDRKWIVKTTKTQSSTRYVPLPQFLVSEFPKTGQIVNLMPDQVSQRFIKYLKRLSIPHFRFHDLRHYAASIMHAIGIPDQYIMQRGGWSSDKTLKAIYRGTMSDYEKQFNDQIIGHFNDMQHEMQHKQKKRL